jgi:hypothetical protein
LGLHSKQSCVQRQDSPIGNKLSWKVLDGVSVDFARHSEEFPRCKKISFLALGTDLPKSSLVSTSYNQTDIASTIAELLNFKLNNGKGKKIRELLD